MRRWLRPPRRRPSHDLPFDFQLKSGRLLLAACREDEFRLIAGRLRRVLQSFQRLIHAEAAGLLTGREFLKGSQKLPDVLLRRHQHEGMVTPPVSIVYTFVVSALERIGAQIEKFRET